MLFVFFKFAFIHFRWKTKQNCWITACPLILKNWYRCKLHRKWLLLFETYWWLFLNFNINSTFFIFKIDIWSQFFIHKREFHLHIMVVDFFFVLCANKRITFKIKCVSFVRNLFLKVRFFFFKRFSFCLFCLLLFLF